MSIEIDEVCYHCGADLPAMAEKFCCDGCKIAFEIIEAGGLDNYYTYRTDFAPRPEKIDSASLEVSDQRIAPDSNGKKSSTFLIQGLHCASCVWLNEKILNSIEGVEAEVHLTTNRAYITWDSTKWKLSDIAAKLAKTGYRLVPVESKDRAQKEQSRSQLRKMAVAGFFTGNMMLISFALYAGYFDVMDGPTRRMFHFLSFLMCIPVLGYSASDFFKNAWQSLKTRTPAMDMLTAAGISIAFIYSLYVTITDIGEVYFDSVAFVTFAILIGRYLEARLRLRSMHYTENLVLQTPRTVRTSNGDTIHIESVQPGMILSIDQGGVVPVDCRLISNTAEIDQSMLNGEYRPVQRNQGDPIYAGSKVTASTIEVECTSNYQSGTLGRISKLTEESMMTAGGANHWAALAGQYFIVFVFLSAGATLFYWWYFQNDLASGILNTIALLIVACPCALNLSVPAASISALQRAFKEGCLVKDGSAMEYLARAKRFAFDKTGTLTYGKMTLKQIHLAGESTQYSEDSVFATARKLQILASVRHPIADAFLSKKADIASLDEFESAEYRSGSGIVAISKKDSTYYLGSDRFLSENGIPVETMKSSGNTVICLGRKIHRSGQNEFLGWFELEDLIRDRADSTISDLKKKSIRISILTGDSKAPAQYVAKQLGIDEIHFQLLPEDKVSIVDDYCKESITVMVGDGINDSAALAKAHCGVSFVSAGQIGLTGADVILIRDRIELVLFLKNLANRARRTILQNLTISFLYNIILIPLAFLGFIIPLVGAILMSLSSISVVINSMLIYRKKIGNS